GPADLLLETDEQIPGIGGRSFPRRRLGRSGRFPRWGRNFSTDRLCRSRGKRVQKLTIGSGLRLRRLGAAALGGKPPLGEEVPRAGETRSTRQNHEPGPENMHREII